MLTEAEKIRHSSNPRKKLPDYDQLKKDAEEQELKIVSFIQGKTDFEKPGKSEKSEKSDKVIESSNPEQFDRYVSMPLVDKHAQGALRRRIVHEQLDRV